MKRLGINAVVLMLLVASCCPCREVRSFTRTQHPGVRYNSREYAKLEYWNQKNSGASKGDACRQVVAKLVDRTMNASWKGMHRAEEGARFRALYNVNRH